jgi:hypothetical protein
MWTDSGNANVEIRTEAAKFPEKEYKNGFFLAVLDEHCECGAVFSNGVLEVGKWVIF